MPASISGVSALSAAAALPPASLRTISSVTAAGSRRTSVVLSATSVLISVPTQSSGSTAACCLTRSGRMPIVLAARSEFAAAWVARMDTSIVLGVHWASTSFIATYSASRRDGSTQYCASMFEQMWCPDHGP